MQKIIIDETYIKHLAQEKVFLTRAEFSILACSTKEQALKMHSDDTADLILVDYNLSEMNIDNFCAHIRTNSRLKNVSIVVAASNKREELDRCMMCGVDAIISKPVDHNELLKTVTKLLEIRKREQPRVLVKISIVGKTTETFYATSQDISVSGILIETG
ncbi:MAG: response regulator, partial [Nitrospirota bacterium]